MEDLIIITIQGFFLYQVIVFLRFGWQKTGFLVIPQFQLIVEYNFMDFCYWIILGLTVQHSTVLCSSIVATLSLSWHVCVALQGKWRDYIWCLHCIWLFHQHLSKKVHFIEEIFWTCFFFSCLFTVAPYGRTISFSYSLLNQ